MGINRRTQVIHCVLLVVIALVFVLPLVWLVLASFDPNANQSLKLPETWTLDNYIGVLTSKVDMRGFGVGLVISLTESLIVTVVSLLAAYPLSRYNLCYKKQFMYAILFMTSLPMIAVIVPVYKMFLNVGLLDSTLGVILYLSASGIPYGIWLMKNFMDTIPISLEEAAWVDGATTMQSIRRIVLPLMLSGVCVVFIYTFSGSWGNFFIPYILLSSADKLPASVILYQYFGQHGSIAYGALAAYSVLYSLPSILLYILSQQYMSKGFTMSGADKG